MRMTPRLEEAIHLHNREQEALKRVRDAQMAVDEIYSRKMALINSLSPLEKRQFFELTFSDKKEMK